MNDMNEKSLNYKVLNEMLEEQEAEENEEEKVVDSPLKASEVKDKMKEQFGDQVEFIEEYKKSEKYPNNTVLKFNINDQDVIELKEYLDNENLIYGLYGKYLFIVAKNDDDKSDKKEKVSNLVNESKMRRKIKMRKMLESLENLPILNDTKATPVVDPVLADAINSSNERAEKVKDAFKDKNKEAKDFVENQDKATAAEKDYKSSDRLHLDESLFVEEIDSDDSLYDEIADFLAGDWPDFKS